ncbi:MAG: haloacid dehalogenase type II [Pseudomonadota bacterium]
MQLKDFKILAFDVYGTLIDWESGMIAGLAPLTARMARPLNRNQILEAHARHESTAQAWTPAKRYRDLLPVVYRRLAEEWGVPVSWGECLAYGASVADWPAFPDSAAALSALQKHVKLVVLTNTDNASFAQSEAKLGVRFDGAFTAEDIGSYKPADRNFAYMLEILAMRGIARNEILHVAESLFHDHVPATRHGLAKCWIYRRHAQDGFGATMNPGEIPPVDWQFTSMAAFAEAMAAARGLPG